ncbi:hypothetical protein BDZ89DRAFT_1132489 [Hymenopellis radicata]|nr:hypothetical protein BDZ89DRAFT_1132489 [Hymenopellis radicata]
MQCVVVFTRITLTCLLTDTPIDEDVVVDIVQSRHYYDDGSLYLLLSNDDTHQVLFCLHGSLITRISAFIGDLCFLRELLMPASNDAPTSSATAKAQSKGPLGSASNPGIITAPEGGVTATQFEVFLDYAYFPDMTSIQRNIPHFRFDLLDTELRRPAIEAHENELLTVLRAADYLLAEHVAAKIKIELHRMSGPAIRQLSLGLELKIEDWIRMGVQRLFILTKLDLSVSEL